jgi:hypothetical protein
MPAFRKVLARSALALAACVALAAAWDVATYDADAWLADHARVKRDMAQGYANLDWIAARRGLDLVALDRRTHDAIANAHSRVRAFIALRSFVHAFGDPHLRMQIGERPVPAKAQAKNSDVQAPQDTPAGADCAASGYEEGDHAFRAPFAKTAGWTPISDSDFPTGMLGDTGVLRVAQLGENQYLAACNAVQRAGMGERELQLAVRARQQDALRKAIATLKSRGTKRLLIDVTGNGGGSEWVSDVIALFTDRTLEREGARVVGPTCDRGNVWRGEKPACDVFAAPGERATLVGTGEWRGPVLVLVDRGTASAAEDLVAWLQQNRVATVLGQRTMGAGCGYVDDGTVTHLTQVPVDVWMPNCARFLADGTNEVDGLPPDVELSLDDPTALRSWLEAH